MIAMPYLIPPHVRHLQSISLCVMHVAGKAHHLAAQDAQPRHVAFVTVIEQHLQADADPKKWFMARCLQYRITQPARLEFAHAVRHRALPGEYHPLCTRDHPGSVAHADFSSRWDSP